MTRCSCWLGDLWLFKLVICVWVCECECVCVCVCTCVCTCLFTYAHRSRWSTGHLRPLAITLCSGLFWPFQTSWSLVCVCMCVCVCECVCTCACVCICVCVYVWVCRHFFAYKWWLYIKKEFPKQGFPSYTLKIPLKPTKPYQMSLFGKHSTKHWETAMHGTHKLGDILAVSSKIVNEHWISILAYHNVIKIKSQVKSSIFTDSFLKKY